MNLGSDTVHTGKCLTTLHHEDEEVSISEMFLPIQVPPRSRKGRFTDIVMPNTFLSKPNKKMNQQKFLI